MKKEMWSKRKLLRYRHMSYRRASLWVQGSLPSPSPICSARPVSDSPSAVHTIGVRRRFLKGSSQTSARTGFLQLRLRGQGTKVGLRPYDANNRRVVLSHLIRFGTRLLTRFLNRLLHGRHLRKLISHYGRSTLWKPIAVLFINGPGLGNKPQRLLSPPCGFPDANPVR